MRGWKADDHDLSRPAPTRPVGALPRKASVSARPAAAASPRRPSGCACLADLLSGDEQHGPHRPACPAQEVAVELVERRRQDLEVAASRLDGRAGAAAPSWLGRAGHGQRALVEPAARVAGAEPFEERAPSGRASTAAAADGSRPGAQFGRGCRPRPAARGPGWRRGRSASSSSVRAWRRAARWRRRRADPTMLVEALTQRGIEAGGRLVEQQQRAGCRAAPGPGRDAGACPWNRCRPAGAPPRPDRRARAARRFARPARRFSRA